MTLQERRTESNREAFDELPKSVQREIAHTLAGYEKCRVKLYGNGYHVETDACIKAVYGQEKLIGEFTAEEIFKGNTQWYNHAWDAYTHRLQRAGEGLNERRVNVFEKWADEQIENFIKNYVN